MLLVDVPALPETNKRTPKKKWDAWKMKLSFWGKKHIFQGRTVNFQPADVCLEYLEVEVLIKKIAW